MEKYKYIYTNSPLQLVEEMNARQINKNDIVSLLYPEKHYLLIYKITKP